jgi:hypothetical protein
MTFPTLKFAMLENDGLSDIAKSYGYIIESWQLVGDNILHPIFVFDL